MRDETTGKPRLVNVLKGDVAELTAAGCLALAPDVVRSTTLEDRRIRIRD